MGAAPSKQAEPATAELNQQIVERLRALELESRQRQNEASSPTEKDYVFLSNDSESRESPPPSYTAIAQSSASTSSSSSSAIEVADAEKWQNDALHDRKNRLALAAFTTTSFKDLITSRQARLSDTQVFNVRIPLEGAPVTNQRASGRCWLFASTNVFRIALMKKYNVAEFELSQAYLFFWDKLEKANYMLESVLETASEPEDGRLVQALLSQPVGDGGQWDMVANLVAKYGLVPQACYPDSFNAQNSSLMTGLITSKLREYALHLRELAPRESAAALRRRKQAMLQEIQTILLLTLGQPPSPTAPFTWEFTDKDGAARKVETTPRAFAAALADPAVVRACGGTDASRLFSLVDDPRHPPLTLLTVAHLGNVRGGRPVSYVNAGAREMRAAAHAMLRRGMPVFFGCDVGKSSDAGAGVMDGALLDYELGFNVRLGMGKGARLRAGDSAMTHAMVLTGVHVEGDGRYVRWRVENSWSAAAGDKGYFVMSDDWFGEFVYQVVVDPGVVRREVRDVLKQRPTVLPLWDPMGALA